MSRLVVVPRERIGDLAPGAKEVLVDLSTRELKSLPPFEPQRPVNEVLERVTYDYYGRQHSLRRAE